MSFQKIHEFLDELGEGADPDLLRRRILIRSCMRPNGFESMENVWMASDFDGAFAEFVTVPATEVFPVTSDWSDAELGSIPCAYGTAENMLSRAEVDANDHVLVSGASGGVGSAAVQLARRRGARVTAIASAAKAEAVLALGADEVLDRDAVPPPDTFDVAVDNVAGLGFGSVVLALRRGGRHVSSGAIGGPLVELDMRNFYLRDICLIGCTAWDEPVFPNLIGYIERGEIRPVVAKILPLRDIVVAQQEFLAMDVTTRTCGSPWRRYLPLLALLGFRPPPDPFDCPERLPPWLRPLPWEWPPPRLGPERPPERRRFPPPPLRFPWP